MSPYSDKEKQKEAVRKAVEKHRQGITEGITSEEGITKTSESRVLQEKDVIPENVIPEVEGITEELRPLLLALGDPVKREKLRRVTEALEYRGLCEKVTLGYGYRAPSFELVKTLLEAF